MNKGLEALDELMSVYFDNECVKRKYGITEETAKEKRRIIEKELEALEVIKEKGNFFSLEHDEYNDKYYIYDNELYMRNEITKEEYELLKEVLE